MWGAGQDREVICRIRFQMDQPVLQILTKPVLDMRGLALNKRPPSCHLGAYISVRETNKKAVHKKVYNVRSDSGTGWREKDSRVMGGRAAKSSVWFRERSNCKGPGASRKAKAVRGEEGRR